MSTDVAPLPLRIPLREREVAFSYLSRLAARNGLTTNEFCADTKIPLIELPQTKPKLVARLAAFGGISAEDLAAWSLSTVNSKIFRFRNEEFNWTAFSRSSIKGCPACLIDDLETYEGRSPRESMAIRGHWLLRQTRICLKHSLPLSVLWQRKAPGHRYNSGARLEEIVDSLLGGEFHGESRSPTKFDIWFDNRLSGKKEDTWLDGFALTSGADFCEMLGRTLMPTGKPRSETDDHENIWQVLQAGYAIAAEGEAAVHETLLGLQGALATPASGPKKAFGPLFDRFSVPTKTNLHGPMRSFLRNHILQNWPYCVGDDLFGEPVTEPRLHSVLTASRQTGIDPRRLRKLLSDAGWVADRETGKEDALECFDAKASDAFLKSLEPEMTAKRLQLELGISRSQFELLQQDGILTPEICAKGAKPIWSLKKAKKIFDQIQSLARVVPSEDPEWLSIGWAAQNLKTRPAMILALIMHGKLANIGRVESEGGYGALRVRAQDVAPLIPRSPAVGLTITEFAKHVGIHPVRSGELIKQGHIKSTLAPNPVTRAMQHYMTDDDIAQFTKVYVTQSQLSALCDTTWFSLRHQLRTLQILRVKPGNNDYGNVYSWSNVEEKLVCRWPRA